MIEQWSDKKVVSHGMRVLSHKNLLGMGVPSPTLNVIDGGKL
jgi:hypothetical protein